MSASIAKKRLLWLKWMTLRMDGGCWEARKGRHVDTRWIDGGFIAFPIAVIKPVLRWRWP